MEEWPGEGQNLDTSTFTPRTVSHFGGELSRRPGNGVPLLECRLVSCERTAEVEVDHPERPEDGTYLCTKHATEAVRVGGELRGAVTPVRGGVEHDRAASRRPREAESPARAGGPRPELETGREARREGFSE